MNKRIAFFTTVGLLGVFLSGARGATKIWTNGGGDYYWTNALNWSAGVPADGDDVLIDGSSPAGTILMAGAKNAGSGSLCKTITITKPGGFDIENVSVAFTGITNFSVSVSNQIVPYTCFTPYVKTCTFEIAAGSVLHASGYRLQSGLGLITVKGGGTFRLNDSVVNAQNFEILDNSTLDYNNADTVNSVRGTGTVSMTRTNSTLLFTTNGLNFNSFTGMVVMGTAGGTTAAFAAFATNAGPVIGMDCMLYTNAGLAQKVTGTLAVPASFSNCIFRGTGKIIAAANGREDAGYLPLTNIYAGCTFRPGTNTASAGVFTCSGNHEFRKAGASNTTLYLDIVGTNGAAGADHDQLVVRKVASGGGFIRSTSSADNANRLADCALVVDLSSLPPNRVLSGKVHTILTTESDLRTNSFASVSWINGTGTVNYLNKSVTLTDVATPPLRGTILLFE